MKKTINALLFLMLLVGWSACQDDNYDLKMNNTDPILVVNARVEGHLAEVHVNLSVSTDFLGDNPKKTVTDALVYVSVDGGNFDQLQHTSNGDYTMSNVKVDEGTTYDLRVEYANEVYTSSTKMLNPIPVLFFLEEETPGFTDPNDTVPRFNFNMILNINFDSTDYYITETRIYNPETQTFVDKSYLQWDDGAYDSNPALFPFFVSDYPKGDSLEVRFSHINQETFEFYNSLNEVGGQNPSSIAPANPIGNISNGAIGQFGAFATVPYYFRIGLR